MEKLPDELIDHILDYLEPTDVVILQGVSRRLLKLARDGPLWRFQCYYDSPKATINRIGQKSWSQALAQALVGEGQPTDGHTRKSNKARATDEWDLSDPSEKVDWYSEYIARHAQLSASWLTPQSANYQDIRGAALFEDKDRKRLVGPLEDGSLCVWDLSRTAGRPSRRHEIDRQPQISSSGILFNDSTTREAAAGSDAKNSLAFSGVADCVSVDAARQRAYVAVGDLLNEVDLITLKVVSRTKYAWSITALSQIQSPQQPLTVGTSFSLHILDPRIPSKPRSRSAVGKEDLEDSVAFFPNKDRERNLYPAKRLHIHPYGGFGTTGLDHHSSIPTPSMLGRRSLFSYAQLEPAPLSILHQTDHSIMVAGRFPSILNYDRRYFPHLEYVIHSSARLSALAYLPVSPRGVKHLSTVEPRGTLISCGEYNGRGSLELYSVPHNASSSPMEPWSSDPSSTASNPFGSNTTATDSSSNSSNSSSSSNNSTPPDITSYKNRQTISSAKLLSVATQGTRIVFSDADGGLKWVERDGKSIARRWNINSYQLHQESFPRLRRGRCTGRGGGSGQMQRFEAAIHGEEVVRKIIPIGSGEADDLLVWTGERVGLVRFGAVEEEEFWDALEDGLVSGGDGSGFADEKKAAGRDDVVKSFDGFVGPRREGVEEGVCGVNDGSEDDRDLEQRAEEYDRQMRRALERQADELNWMNRFGFGGGGG